MTDSSDEGEAGDLFKDPDGFYEPEKEPTFVKHQLLDGRELTLRLVGHNPLWGHHLWQGALSLSTYLQTHQPPLIHPHKTRTLELGAGAGLPTLICALLGAGHSLLTDYPDAELIENLQYNATNNDVPPNTIETRSYLWGTPLSNPKDDGGETFDLVLMADLLFNHSEHPALFQSLRSTLAKTAEAQALVFFTPYRPWLFEKDLAFFDLVRGTGEMEVEKVHEEVREKVMFEGDPGDELLRRTVFGYSIRWKPEVLEAQDAA